MALTTAQLEAFQRDGYVLVPDVFSQEEMALALEATERTFYDGKRFAEWRETIDPATGAVRDGFNSGTEGRSQFPTGNPTLDRLIESERYLDMFAECLGTPEMRYCNAHLFLRSGPTDKRHAPNPWEGYHIDHDTNSFLPPGAPLGRYDYVNSGVYLHDVEEDGAPMHVIPGSHTQVLDLLPRLFEEGAFRPPTTFPDIRLVPEFATPVPAMAKTGSAIFYSSYLVHAAVPFRNKRKQRVFWTLSLGRAENEAYNRFSNAYSYADRGFTVPFWKTTTPRVRSLFGWPPPGDPYYTPATLANLERWYPGIDLTPYRTG